MSHDVRDDFDDQPYRGPLAPESTVTDSALLLRLVGVAQFIATQFLTAVLIVSAIRPANPDPLSSGPRISLTPLGTVGLWLLGTVSSVIILLGSKYLKEFRRFPLVVAAAILTALSLPFVCLALIGLPIATTTLITLARRDVRARFEANARGPQNPPENACTPPDGR